MAHDVLRKLHPNDKKWRAPDQKMKYRLDYWLVSNHLLPQSAVSKCHIQIASHCDHFLVFWELKANIQPPRGPGFWKFNCSLLDDCDYTEKMAPKIVQP